MKKTFTLLLLFVASLSFAQVNLAIKSIDQPTFMKDNPDGQSTNFTLAFTMTNKGPALNPGDSIVYTFGVINRDATPPAFVFSPTARLILIAQRIETGVDFSINPQNFQVNTIMGKTTNIDVAVAAFVTNRKTSPIDTDSTDNTVLKSILWEKQYGASVEATTFKNNVALFPNPANNVLNVEILAAQRDGVSIEVIDLTGKVVIQVNDVTPINANKYQLNVEGLERGIYLVKITNGDAVTTEKVTITH